MKKITDEQMGQIFAVLEGWKGCQTILESHPYEVTMGGQPVERLAFFPSNLDEMDSYSGLQYDARNDTDEALKLLGKLCDWHGCDIGIGRGMYWELIGPDDMKNRVFDCPVSGRDFCLGVCAFAYEVLEKDINDL